MKKYFLLFIAVLGFIACNNKNTSQEDTKTQPEETVKSAASVIELDKLLAQAEEYVNKPVTVKGYVTHTCKHAGRRCFLTGESQEYTVRVEAKGKIGGFNRELIGSEIEVTGTLHEKRLNPDEIAQMEQSIEEKRIKNDGSEEACDAETANIQKMREWMKEHGKDYYAIYYIDGEDYHEVGQ